MQRALRSPWLGPLVIAISGVIGFVASRDAAPRVLDEVRVTVRATRDNGSPWDFGGGRPDPKIRVVQGERTLASCPEVKDQLEATCRVNAVIDGGPLRVVVVDGDTAEDDAIGELAIVIGAHARSTTTGTGALQAVEAVTRSGEGRAARHRPLWISLGIGVVLALALAAYRRRR